MTVRVCLGGTFNHIHQGHLALLKRACEEGDEIFIGLTSDKMARSTRKVKVNSYATRMFNLAEAVEKVCSEKDFSIRVINDGVGPAATGDYDVIVVSTETVPGAETINRIRSRAGLKPLKISVVEMVLDGKGERVSSTKVSGQEG